VGAARAPVQQAFRPPALRIRSLCSRWVISRLGTRSRCALHAVEPLYRTTAGQEGTRTDLPFRAARKIAASTAIAVASIAHPSNRAGDELSTTARSAKLLSIIAMTQYARDRFH
jgi:hypothetical protein